MSHYDTRTPQGSSRSSGCSPRDSFKLAMRIGEASFLGVLPSELLKEIFKQYVRIERARFLIKIGAPRGEYSIRDYIQEHGQPVLRKNNVILYYKHLTSLGGLELIDNPEQITLINLIENYFSNYYDPYLDPYVYYVVHDMQSWIGPFRGFTNLTTLFLTSNKFTALPANVFEGLQNLEWIILANNQLSELPAGVFGGLQKLTELHLHQNQLATLPVNVFEGLQNLKRLYLYGNQLSGTKEQFRALHGLGNQIYILWDPQNPSAGLQQLHLLRRGYFPYLSQAHSSFFRI